MPLFMGMGLGVNWTLGAATQMVPSLVGHLIFGAILGGTYKWLETGPNQSRSNFENAKAA